MRFMQVVRWRYSGVWKTSAAFVEPKEAEEYARNLSEEFPADDVRIELMKVTVHDDEYWSK